MTSEEMQIRRQHTIPIAAIFEPGTGGGIKRADLAFDHFGALEKIDPRFGLVDFCGIGDAIFGLRLGRFGRRRGAGLGRNARTERQRFFRHPVQVGGIDPARSKPAFDVHEHQGRGG